MTNPKIWLSSPHMGGTEQKYITEAFTHNWVAPLGPNVNGFEQDLQTFTGSPHAAALSSGTAALHLALILLDVKPGDFVICQSFTFSASANPIAYQGAIPVFVDSEPDTWNMSPAHLETAIKACMSGEMRYKGQKMPAAKPKAIVPVHLYGMPAKMEEIVKMANTYDIPVVEDAAEALGSGINGQECGTFGKFGVLSFNGNKIITTSGGGALLSEDGEAIAKSRFLATQARDQAPHYQHSHIGYNYRMSNIVAGIGRGQMEVLKERIAARRSNFERYAAWFGKLKTKGYNIKLQPEPQGYLANRWLTAITINPDENKGITRETLRLAFEAENIETRPLWKPMHLQPVFEGCPYFGDGTSEKLFEDGLCLPSGSTLTEADFKRIFEVLARVFMQ
ncbi:MAG: DegT/DnrJ/EryC1/StrS family aminotransferase [Lentimicrobium sp.]|nr:DegT/DnrJ/EryC1/StrS family aminotransferase [Lentimicrobium sp.]